MHSMSSQQERDNLSKAFTVALQDWREHSWSAFGSQLGSILRDMIVLTFPQKYSVDAAGRLRRSMQRLSEAQRTASRISPLQGLSFGLFCAFAMLVLAGGFLLSLKRAKGSVVEMRPEFERRTLLQEATLQQEIIASEAVE